MPEPTNRFLSSLHEGRLWVALMWSLAVAVGVAAFDVADRQIRADAARQQMILMPATEMDATARRAAKMKMLADPAVVSVRWRSPAESLRDLSRRFTQPQWRDLMPREDQALPWLLEVQPADPLGGNAQIRDLIARHRKDGWLVLWNNEPLLRLVHARRGLWTLGGLWLTLLTAAGALALLCLPIPAQGALALAIWSSACGLIAPGAVAAGVWLAGGPVDARALVLALTIGFILAGPLAAVLRRPQTKASLSVTVGEANDERQSSD